MCVLSTCLLLLLFFFASFQRANVYEVVRREKVAISTAGLEALQVGGPLVALCVTYPCGGVLL